MQSNEVNGSYFMEKEGLQRAVAKLQENGLSLNTIVTDRHCQIAKWIRDELPNVVHFYDVWHIAKVIFVCAINIDLETM
jgi:solute carrier family 8 (sodium/calcium exchanger)